MPKSIDITGKKFNKLTAVSLVSRVKGISLWRFKCDCGAVIERDLRVVSSGNTTSCGCYRKKTAAQNARKSIKHGRASNKYVSKVYTAWINMKERCNNINHSSYSYYGGRGIKVCRRWSTNFKLFLQDMGEPPGKEYTIERIHNNEGYNPKNCYWATIKEQSQNKRTNVYLQYKGKRLNLTQFAYELGVSKHLVWRRIRRDRWSIRKFISYYSK